MLVTNISDRPHRYEDRATGIRTVWQPFGQDGCVRDVEPALAHRLVAAHPDKLQLDDHEPKPAAPVPPAPPADVHDEPKPGSVKDLPVAKLQAAIPDASLEQLQAWRDEEAARGSDARTTALGLLDAAIAERQASGEGPPAA